MSFSEAMRLMDLARQRGGTVTEYRPVPMPELPAEARKSEKQFQAEVIKLAKRCGWRAWHNTISLKSAAGFPDLFLCRCLRKNESGRIIFAELKTDTGKLTPAQEEFLADIRQTGCVEVYEWRPRDWAEIERILA